LLAKRKVTKLARVDPSAAVASQGVAGAEPSETGALGVPPRLRILHFAFEEPGQPDRGGGATRTFEINRRLASHHQITVVARKYPGARRRTEDGIEYRHLGIASKRLGRLPSIVSYHLAVPIFALFHSADLVVEDFAAPMSSIALPLFTRDPTIAVVQWLFAREASRKYRFPFFLAESLGVRVHRHFVAVSGYIATEIYRRHPTASVTIAYAGVADSLHEVEPWPERKRELLYLGRLQLHEKGLDLLLASFAVLAERDPDVRLVIAGDGYDTEEVKNLASELGLSRRVDFVSRIDGDKKRDYLRRAMAVVMPSRFESFGLVAVEALASATPVIGFSLPSLLEIVTPECGILVTPFDTNEFALACSAILDDPERRARLGEAGRDRSVRFSWDEAAARQEAAYLAAAGKGAGSSSPTAIDGAKSPSRTHFRRPI
jgi:glycosyltransferase involved in cell wall biosynthesis